MFAISLIMTHAKVVQSVPSRDSLGEVLLDKHGWEWLGLLA